MSTTHWSYLVYYIICYIACDRNIIIYIACDNIICGILLYMVYYDMWYTIICVRSLFEKVSLFWLVIFENQILAEMGAAVKQPALC